MKKIICFIAAMLTIIGYSVAQKWEKNQPNKLFAVDKNQNVSNVKVGIGTSVPLFPLEVKGKTVVDSLHVKNFIEIGNSIWLGTSDMFTNTNDIFADDGDLIIQSANNFNTILNAGTLGVVSIGTDWPVNSDKLQILGNVSVNNEPSKTFSYCIDGNSILNYRGRPTNTFSQISTTNLFVGVDAGANTKVFLNGGLFNTFVGYQAGYNNESTSDNTFMGYQAGYSNRGNSNSYFGSKAGYNNVNGFENTFIGNSAGLNFAGGGYPEPDANTFVGYASGLNTTSGIRNTFVGWKSGVANTTGESNTAIGWNAGKTITTGYRNTFLGENADAGSNNIINSTAIGHCSYVTASNCIVLGSVPGYNGLGPNYEWIKVGIGTPAPGNRLEVVEGNVGNSGLRLTSLAGYSPTAPTTTALTVNGSGDVILANVTPGGTGNVSSCTGTPGPVVNYVTKWTAPNTICNSIIYDNGTQVGIGNNFTSPVSTLHINSSNDAIPTGEVFRTDCPETENSYWRMFRGGVEKATIFSPSVSPTTGNSDLIIEAPETGSHILFNVYNSTTRMIISDGSHPGNSGFVGIGKNFLYPQSLLHLNDGIYEVYQQITNDATGSSASDGLRIGIESNGTARINMQEDKNLLFLVGTSSNPERMRIVGTPGPNYGFVGIGNSFSDMLPPKRRLDVLDNTGPQLRLSQSASLGTLYGTYTDFQTTAIGDLYINPRHGQTNSNRRVGINISTPGNTLEINSIATDATIGNSGLKFTDLWSSSQQQPPNGVALSVDNDGDVILVSDGSGLPVACDNGTHWDNPMNEVHWGGTLIENTTVNFSNNNVVFNDPLISSPGTNLFSIGNGVNLIPMIRKFSVDNTTEPITSLFQSNNPLQRANIVSFYDAINTSPANDLVGIESRIYRGKQPLGTVKPRNIAYHALINNSIVTNIGVFSEVLQNPSSVNYAGLFSCNNSGNINYGISARSQAGLTNYGITAYAGISTFISQNIGIYSSAPQYPVPNEHLSVAAYINGNLDGVGTFLYGSDKRLKDSIKSISTSLDLLRQIHPAEFSYKTDEFPNISLPFGKQVGLIAQDVEPIFPDLVKISVFPAQYDSVGDLIADTIMYKSINYNGFIPITIRAVQELDSALNNLEQTSPPAKPILISPANNSSGLLLNNTFTWHKAIRAANYTLIISPGVSINTTDTFAVVTLPKYCTNYQWWVIAYNEAGVEIKADAWSFSVISPPIPLAPVLSLPEDMAVNLPLSNTFNWNASANAESYTFMITTMTVKGEMQVYKAIIPDTFVTASVPDYNVTYNWYVAANNCSGQGAISEKRTFTTQIRSMGTSLPVLSDSVYKSNPGLLADALSKILQINGYYFYWNTQQYPELQDTNRQIGFIAQQVEPVIPEVVSSDAGGVHYVDYNRMVPVLTEAIKELNTTMQQKDSVINSLDARLTALEEMYNQCCSGNKILFDNSTTVREVELSDVPAIVLDQNVPNPFAESTSISYLIPENIISAQIIFTDNSGRIIKVVDISERGKGLLKVFAQDLSSGIYSYTLVADGKTIDTKKMVKSMK